MKKILMLILLIGMTFSLVADSSTDQEASYYYYKGCALNYGNGNQLEALDCLNRSIALLPNEANCWQVRGSIWFSLGNYSEAIKDFTQAINLCPTHAKAYVGRALAYVKMGNMHAVRADMVIAAKLGSPEAQAVANAWRWSY